MRIEKDSIGELPLPNNALYGIHSVRAKNNFPDKTVFHKEWYMAVGIVKQACYLTIKSFSSTVYEKYPLKHKKLKLPNDKIIDTLISSAKNISQGDGFDNFIIPAIQGGAGTSINMNINEIITNLSLKKINKPLGSYKTISPIEHANLYQSTNDVIPTALKITVLNFLNELENQINNTRKEIELLENKYRNNLRIGYTQMQQAVPSSFGMFFGSFNDALSRDWWRVSKCFERIKTVNMGGGAIGSGISIPRFFIIEIVPKLIKLTGLPITQSENLSDNTSNLDSWVEIHAILKAHAVTLEKMVTDIRLLSSDIVFNKEIELPSVQTGSSIMPGKVNPVIIEFIISAVHKIYSNDNLITQLSSMGTLELNAYIPTIGHAIIESLKLLINCNETLNKNLFNKVKILSDTAVDALYKSGVICTALNHIIGYHKSEKLSQYMKKNKCSIFEANEKLKILNIEDLRNYMKSNFLLKKGFTLNDI